MLTKGNSTTSVEMRRAISRDKAQQMETLSQTFHLKTFLTCSLVEAILQVSVAFLIFPRCCIYAPIYFKIYVIYLGHANGYTNGRMRYPRRERRERQGDVSPLASCNGAGVVMQTSSTRGMH